MATQVIKSDGTKVSFDAKKISRAITKAAKDAKLTPEEINKVVTEVSNIVITFIESQEEILSSDIRDRILSELDLLEPKVSAAWRKYLQAQGGTCSSC